jgi:hypothetical protein
MTVTNKLCYNIQINLTQISKKKKKKKSLTQNLKVEGKFKILVKLFREFQAWYQKGNSTIKHLN